MISELKALLERLKWPAAREGQMVFVSKDGVPTTDPDYAEGNGSNSTFGVYNYTSPTEAGVDDVLSDQLTRAGLHNFRFNTKEMANMPFGWKQKAENTGGNATMLVLPSGQDGSVHRILTMVETAEMWCSWGTWRDIYWGVLSGSVPDTNPLYLCSRNSGGYSWLSNRKSGTALVAQMYGGRKLYLTPMQFPSDMNLAEALVNMTSLTGVTALNQIQIRIHEVDPMNPTIGEMIGRGVVAAGSATGVKKATLVKADGSVGPIHVYAGRTYWVGFSIDNATGVQLSALPVSDRTILAAADETDLIGTAPKVCTELIMVNTDSAMGGTMPSINELVTLAPPFVGFKPTF